MLPSKFELKRASIKFTELGKDSTYIRRGKVLALNDITHTRAAMAAMTVPQERQELGRRSISRSRSSYNRNQVHLFVINVTLKDPIFKGYSREFTVEYDPTFEKNIRVVLKEQINRTIRSFRVERRREPAFLGKIGNFHATFAGNKKDRVFNKPEQILKLYVDKNMQSLYAEKKPEVINRYVGIELEFCAPITEPKLALELFKAGVSKFVQLKKDGSLRPKDGELGFEVAILLKESEYKRGLKKVIDVLSKVKAVASERRCGLHVHLDMRRRNKDVVYNNLVASQDILFKIVDPSRADNEFCRKVTSRKFPIEFTGDREERYRTINAAAYYKYRTIEVRMHEGSTDYTQIVNWIGILIKIASYKKKLKDDISSLITFKKRFKLDYKLNNYAIERSCHFAINNPQPRARLRIPVMPSSDPVPLRSEEVSSEEIR